MIYLSSFDIAELGEVSRQQQSIVLCGFPMQFPEWWPEFGGRWLNDCGITKVKRKALFDISDTRLDHGDLGADQARSRRGILPVHLKGYVMSLQSEAINRRRLGQKGLRFPHFHRQG